MYLSEDGCSGESDEEIISLNGGELVSGNNCLKTFFETSLPRVYDGHQGPKNIQVFNSETSVGRCDEPTFESSVNRPKPFYIRSYKSTSLVNSSLFYSNIGELNSTCDANVCKPTQKLSKQNKIGNANKSSNRLKSLCMQS